MIERPRKVASVAVSMIASPEGFLETCTVAVCEEGKVWSLSRGSWVKLPALPPILTPDPEIDQ